MMTAPLPANHLRYFPVGYLHLLGQQRSQTRTRRLPDRSQPRGHRPRIDAPTDIMFIDGVGGARGTHRHGAIDILGALGLPVIAARTGRVPERWSIVHDGEVTRLRGCGRNERGGNFVTLVDDQGYYHYYCHMEFSRRFDAGRLIRAGTLLGYLGGTGSQARGRYQHLHYQVTRRNAAGGPIRGGIVNPYRELVRVAQRCGGGFETRSIPGYSNHVRWMVIRPENYRRQWWVA